MSYVIEIIDFEVLLHQLGRIMRDYQRYILLAIIIISIGITLSTSMADTTGSLGTVMIAVGGLFFIAGMARKSKAEKADKKNEER